MPKSFGFHNELQKGFFPHDLNMKDNMDYKCLGLPDRKYFGTNEMMIETLKRFEEWYVDEDRRLRNNDIQYVLREEMIKYCYDDCNVLSSAFSKFNESMIIELKNSGVVDIVDHQYTILADFITLPQMVIHWFVGVMLPERTLSIVPHRGYEWGKCGSYKERVWLTWLDKQNAKEEGESFVPIQSRYSSEGQMKVDRYYLDGFRELECGKHVCYEFYGCYYHSCIVCFPDRNKVIRKKHREEGHWTVRDASEYTLEREAAIKRFIEFRENLDEFVVMWEHEYNAREKEMKECIGEDDLYHMVDRLNPRDAVKGGRTEAFRMHCSITNPNEEEIKYLDVNSLYPYVMSKVEFPIGHPEIRRGDESCRNYIKSLSEPFIGLCMVKILPPSNLSFPCLAHKMNGKLLFSLCRTCSMSNEIQRKPCIHMEEQRAWIDVYTSIDMESALERGYTVLKYYELWHYPKGGSPLFKDFILNIVRRKIECSGFPSDCKDRRSKEDYLLEMKRACGININSLDRVKKDPAGRYLNKIMANSVWGKWAQNPSSQYEVKMCSTIVEYHRRLLTGCVKRVTLLKEDLLQVEIKCDRGIDGENRERENSRSGLGGRNTIVGSFVAAAARRLMYDRYLSKLSEEQLLYTDTDSIVMYRRKGNVNHVELPTSNLLGELKDEHEELLVENPTRYVQEFFAFGPKMYQLIFKDEITNRVVRWDKTMKGVSLSGNRSMLTLDKISPYRNPVIDYCSILQFSPMHKFHSLGDVREKMFELERKRRGRPLAKELCLSIVFDQCIFKKNISSVTTDRFIMTIKGQKRVRVTQSKRFPRPVEYNDTFSCTYPIGWK